MKKQIWKFSFQQSRLAGREIAMPEKAEILTVQMQNDEITLWAICDPEAKKVTRKFDIVGTGWAYNFADKKYIGTVQDGAYVWHLFEILQS